MCAATASAPCSRSEASARRTPPSILSSTSGSSTAKRAPKSPSREAAKNASTTRLAARGHGPAPASCASAGGRGWRAAGRPLRSGRARWRYRRTAHQTRRAAQTQVARRESARRAPPAAPDQRTPPAELLFQAFPLDANHRIREVHRKFFARAARAACSGRHDRRPWQPGLHGTSRPPVPRPRSPCCRPTPPNAPRRPRSARSPFLATGCRERSHDLGTWMGRR